MVGVEKTGKVEMKKKNKNRAIKWTVADEVEFIQGLPDEETKSKYIRLSLKRDSWVARKMFLNNLTNPIL